MYVDKDFNNELVSLTDMSELENLSSIRLVGIENVSVEAESANSLQEGNSSQVSAPVPLPVSSLRKSTGWPEVFVVPQFEHGVELLLQRGNKEYAESVQLLNIPRSCKSSILKRIAAAMYDIKAYPEISEYWAAAEAVVAKFPCLHDDGSKGGVHAIRRLSVKN